MNVTHMPHIKIIFCFVREKVASREELEVRKQILSGDPGYISIYKELFL